MSGISVIIITKNEEASLPRCLASVTWANQIVVVDSGSTDRTCEIASAHHADVFIENWKGYTRQKNSAIEKVTEDWILSLDADEEFTPEAQKDILRLVRENDPTVEAYSFRRKVLYLGKWIKHGDWYPDDVVRLWRRGKGVFEGGRVHESVKVNGRVQRCESEILHYTYKDLDDQRRRMEKYSALWAQDQFDRGRQFHLWDLCLRPPMRFIRAILLKSGWLDGWRGWMIAWMCSREVWMKYSKLKDLHRAAAS